MRISHVTRESVVRAAEQRPFTSSRSSERQKTERDTEEKQWIEERRPRPTPSGWRTDRGAVGFGLDDDLWSNARTQNVRRSRERGGTATLNGGAQAPTAARRPPPPAHLSDSEKLKDNAKMSSPPMRRFAHVQQQHGDVASPSNSQLHVHRMETDTLGAQPVALVKLTDECLSAIRDAQRRKAKLRISVDATGGGVLEVGSGPDKAVFRFATNALQDQAPDVVRHEPGRQTMGGRYSTVGTVHTKFQIQATEKTFDDTRKRAKELVQEQEKAKPKDVGRHRRDEKPKSVSRPLATSFAATSSHQSTSSKFGPSATMGSSKTESGGSRISPKFGSTALIGATTGSSAGNTGSGGVAPVLRLPPNKHAELLKKSIRQRIVHLVVTGRFTTPTEIMQRITSDGLPEDVDQRQLESVIQEVSERMEGSKSGRLTLRRSCLPEVDINWFWFTSEEKAYVRKLFPNQSASSSVVAPMRKSGMSRLVPSSGSGGPSSNTVSPEAVPTPPASQSGRRVSPLASQLLSQPHKKEQASPSQTVLDEMPASQTTKRKAHVPAAVLPDKRPRGESLSPPEDPTSATPSQPPPRHQTSGVSHQTTSTTRDKYASSSSSSSSRNTSPSFAFGSPKPQTVDWEARFPEAKTMADAEKYFDAFHDDYPEYMRAFKHLNKIAAEFRELERALHAAPKGSREHERIERDIHRRFEFYQRDETFAKDRQKHADLRHKLNVLKMRIQQWERQHQDEAARVSGRQPPINYESIFAL